MTVSPQSIPAAPPVPGERYAARRRAPRRRSWTLKQGVLIASWGYLACVLGILGVLQFVSESWWLGVVLTYMPRSPFLIPGLVGLPIAWKLARHGIPVLLFGCLVVVGPIMGLHGNPLNLVRTVPTSPEELRIVSCNVQGFRPIFADVVEEISHIRPHVVLFQEAYDDHKLMHSYFADWHVIREGNHVVASQYPVTLLDKIETTAFQRVTALRVEVQTPQGKIQVYSIHQTSQRESLVYLRPWSFITGAGTGDVRNEADLRLLEAKETRRFVDNGDPQLPTLYAGDFNVTRDSSIYQSCWGDLINAFDLGGFGYGYSGLCHTKHFWPSGWPWVKVDHILTSAHWETRECRIGVSNGSDHRLIMGRFLLKTH